MIKKSLLAIILALFSNYLAIGQIKSNCVRVSIGVNKLLMPISILSQFNSDKSKFGIYTELTFMRLIENESRSFFFGASYGFQQVRRDFSGFNASLNNPEHEMIPNISIQYTQGIQNFSLLFGFQQKLNRRFSLALEAKLGFSNGFTPKVDHRVSYDSNSYWLPRTKVYHYLTRDNLKFISYGIGLSLNYHLTKVWKISLNYGYSGDLPVFNNMFNSYTLPVISIIDVNDKSYQNNAIRKFSTLNSNLSLTYNF